MQETLMKDKERALKIVQLLETEYPDAECALEYSSPYELLIATILSAQCTDKQVNKCTKVLFAEYNTPYKMLTLSEDTLATYIKGCGLYKTKGKNILATSAILAGSFNGEVPHDRETLMSLPGVGRKTANVVLSNAFGVPAIAVDTHVQRVANRLGLAKAKDVLNTEKQLMQCLPESEWGRMHHCLIFHGRRICTARKPMCEKCPVSGLCSFLIGE